MSRQTPVPALILKCTLLACLLLPMTGCDAPREELTHVDSDKEANRILVELELHGIRDARKVEKSEQRKTSYSITVLPADLSRARSVLVECDLPREVHSGLAAIAESGSLIPSKSEERARLIHAISGELERTFETYDRVVSARVQIAMPEKDLLARESATRPSATAMVLIKYTPLVTGNLTTNEAPVTADDVQQMVARSVDGLLPTNVFVTFTRSAPHTMPGAAGSAGSPAAAGSSGSSLGDNKNLTFELFIAVAVFGVISILLTALLVREKRRQRLAAA